MKKKKGPCWKGYEAVGMKMKGGRKVPNCVPVKESVDRILTILSEEKPVSSFWGHVITSAKGPEGKKPEPKDLPRPKDPKYEKKAMAAGRTPKPKSPRFKGAKPKPLLQSVERSGDLITEVAAWQKKAGKNPSGGLNKKGVASYRRENPGSKLKTAVTTKPSKLKKGSKAAKRRKSFCARMGGMKKRRTSAKTANNPDSRINKALRKWNC